MSVLFKVCTSTLQNLLQARPNVLSIPVRCHKVKLPKPRKRLSPWLIKPTRAMANEMLTEENTKFLKDVVRDRYPQASPIGIPSTPLKLDLIEPATTTEWHPRLRRAGVIAKKIGVIPLWFKNGERNFVTLLHVVDNHVINYVPPEKFNPRISKKKYYEEAKYGILLVGAQSADPQIFTKAYCEIFENSGVMPKRVLSRYIISPEAALQPGTPLNATHFKVGDYVDIRAKTMDRGFQGVMKRWGFHGMPASHGVTKTHRRPGCIGGGAVAKVAPGKKLPGHMGNKIRRLNGQRIIRINTKYNVLYVLGQAIPGETNSYCFLYDTMLPLRRREIKPPFPTYIPKDGEELPEDLCIDELFNFNDPSIVFEDDSKTKKK